MIERFLRYSLAHNRKIRVVMADSLKCRNITVIAMEGENVFFLTAGRKKPERVLVGDILSAAYARGDTGDTLQYEPKEE